MGTRVRSVINVMAAPGTEEPPLILQADAVDEMALVLVNGCCCYNDGLYLDGGCCGCSGKSELLCLGVSFCCAAGTNPICCVPPENYACQTGCCCIGYGIKTENIVCAAAQAQVCCLVSNLAIPCTDEVPATVSCLGLNCYPKFGFCQTLGAVTGRKTRTELIEEEAQKKVDDVKQDIKEAGDDLGSSLAAAGVTLTVNGEQVVGPDVEAAKNS